MSLTLAGALTAPVCAWADGYTDAWRVASRADRAFALRLARRAFDAYALDRRVLPAPSRLPEPFRGRSGVFVSAMRRGAPRCCMGSLWPTEGNLASEIVAAAVSAAGRDLRFRPVAPGELRGLALIVSFVAPCGSITRQEALQLDPTRQGLAVRGRGGKVGVTLSGETDDARTMLEWARIRSGARASDPLEFIRLEVVRLVEGRDDLSP
ncbi:MAG: AMMECR1 domain-containing protein [Armatimonadetes bacterium]|nr:AMMECR1 domain-containing protein [Armatimonadota bacterium]